MVERTGKRRRWGHIRAGLWCDTCERRKGRKEDWIGGVTARQMENSVAKKESSVMPEWPGVLIAWEQPGERASGQDEARCEG